MHTPTGISQRLPVAFYEKGRPCWLPPPGLKKMKPYLRENKMELGKVISTMRGNYSFPHGVSKIFCVIFFMVIYPCAAAANRCRYNPESCDPYYGTSEIGSFGLLFVFLAFVWVNLGAFIIGVYIAEKVFKSENGGVLCLGVLIGYGISIGSLFFVIQNFAEREVFLGIMSVLAVILYKIRKSG